MSFLFPQEVKAEIDGAIEEAKAAPYPEAKELWADIYRGEPIAICPRSNFGLKVCVVGWVQSLALGSFPAREQIKVWVHLLPTQAAAPPAPPRFHPQSRWA